MMSLAVGAVSSSKNMALDETKEGSTGQQGNAQEITDESLKRSVSENSLCTTEEEGGEEEEEGYDIQPGPQFSLKEQLEKDKEDESLRRWKEQLLGAVDMESVGVIPHPMGHSFLFLGKLRFGEIRETLEPDVKILSLSILSPDRPEIVLPIPEDGKPKGSWFTLKEGSRYRLKFSFRVRNNIVSGLKYRNIVWKTSMKVDSSKEMLGTFSPQEDPYTHVIPEEITPSGFFARGSYTARTKFVDDDNKCHLEINYTFDIKKDWVTP